MIQLSPVKRRALHLRAKKFCPLKLCVGERRALKVRAFQRCALKLSACEIGPRQTGKSEYGPPKIATAGEKDEIPRLRFLGIVDAEALKDVEANED